MPQPPQFLLSFHPPAPSPDVQREAAQRAWDAWLKIASILCTCVVVPGIGWAFSVQKSLSELHAAVEWIAKQAEKDRAGVSNLLDELKHMRSDLAQLRTDLAQRITRVETKLEQLEKR